MFILGIKAPGISTVRDYYSRYSDTEVGSLFEVSVNIIFANVLKYFISNMILVHQNSIFFSIWLEMKKVMEMALQKLDQLLIGRLGKSLGVTCVY